MKKMMSEFVQAGECSRRFIEQRIDDDKPFGSLWGFSGAVVAENIRLVFADGEVDSFFFGDSFDIIKAVRVEIEFRKGAFQ